jgi:hypothetical protein
MMDGGTPNVFYADGAKGNTIDDWSWNSTTGWQQLFFYGDPVAAGSSPAAMMDGGTPNVFYVDGAKGDTIDDWSWNSTQGWHQLFFYGDPVAAGSSPTAVMDGSTPNVFYQWAPSGGSGGTGTSTGPVVTHAVTLALPVPAARGRKHRRQVHAKIVLSWTWNHSRTRLQGVRITGMPRHGRLTIECRGRGCPRSGYVATAHQLGPLLKALRGTRYRAGDRLLITILAPGAKSERAEVTIRNGALPRAKLI